MGRADALTRGQHAFERRNWNVAYAELSAADEETRLDPTDLERLGTAAYLVGREGDAFGTWQRSYDAHVERGDPEPAARLACWLSLHLLLKGELAQSSGWLSRGQRLLGDREAVCAEQGYVCILLGLRALGGGDAATARASFEEAFALARRFGDRDLLALGLLGRGQAAFIDSHDVGEAQALLDEAMLEVTAGFVSPITSGIVYCAVILACTRVFDVRRAREWTSALDAWCDAQPDLVPFRGRCLVHRSEVKQLMGEWAAALDEAKRACQWLAQNAERSVGHAYYQCAELHRLRGELEEAERMYREAGSCGLDPQPGLSLLRLSQGQAEAAEAAMRRVVDQARGGAPRPDVLGALVEIALAKGDGQTARARAEELAELAAQWEAPLLLARAAGARGAALLIEGDARAAVGALREAWTLWQELNAPYEAARVRVWLATSCELLGDHDTAQIHRDAARAVFERLGAAPELARLAQRAAPGDSAAGGPAAGESVTALTTREREVLVLVASGKTNREIAAELVISEHTVARHISNIFNKIGVTSRTAASAFAFANGLVR